MLEVTMATDFLPGTNLKGVVAGGNWTFVLPRLDLEQVVSIGVPSVATLATLSRNAARVLVVCRNRRQFHAARQIVQERGLSNVRPLTPSRNQTWEIANGSTDLVILADRIELFRFAFSGRARVRSKQWLKPDGQIYFELPGLAYWFVIPTIRGHGKSRFGDSQLLWITPLLGESQTFTALGDRETIRYFREQRLISASLRSGTLKHLSTPGTAQSNRRPTGEDRPGDSTKPRRSNRAGRWLRKITAILRPAARAVLRGCNRCEHYLSRPNGLSGWMGRRGVLVGPHASRLNREPPQYLQAIAREAGISIDSHRWGLSATGDYDTRKLVFFLFERDQSTPQYVVKMTRSAAFNGRLEQERRALELLEEQGIGDRETLPRIVFSGTHGGLAIVGETSIDGVPFDRRTTATANCPYARAAIDWLTELGAATVAPFAAEPGEVATGLQRLLSRFAEIYAISPDEHAFLRAQVSVIEFNRVPLVFQHGDPGRWNVFVTSKGRIGFLDWEAAEPNGMPLWDLLYFLRSFCICVADKQRRGDRLRSLDELLLQNSPLAELAVDSVRNYCMDTGLPGHLVEPLFHTCWMHRALKEATRLPPAKLRDGHYFNLLRMCREKRESPTLRRLFAIG